MKYLKPLLSCLALVAFLATPMFAVAAEKGKADLPAANGKDLWNYLQQVKYRESFALWPGKGKLYTRGLQCIRVPLPHDR
jgi:hypothetical protein